MQAHAIRPAPDFALHNATAAAVAAEAAPDAAPNAAPASPGAPEWSDLVQQFLALSGSRPTPPHLPAIGRDDQAHHLVQQGVPIITTVDHYEVDGGVIRPLVDPVVVYPWSIVWRPGAHRPGVGAILEAADTLARADNWATLPPDAWLPEPEVRGVLGPVLEGFTDATVTDVSRLLGELGQIRERGYAMSAGELEPALCGVSAPVLRRGEDRPLAVFSIWGPADRVPPPRFQALGAVAIEAAASVEAALRD